jgi:hypothetical protein
VLDTLRELIPRYYITTRGHGRSLRIETGTYVSGFSIDLHCLDVAPLLRQLGLTGFRPHVVDPA